MTISSLASTSWASQVQSTTSATQLSQTGASKKSDGSQLSDLSELMKQLKSLFSSDPQKFKEVTASIASSLNEAAQSATEAGDTEQAKLLTELADKFQTASENSQMPDMEPSGKAPVGGPPPGGGPRGPGGPPPSEDTEDDEDEDDLTTTSTTSAAAQYQQFMELVQQESGTDPLSILTDALKTALS